jgi:REP element-mobilizing transposase RayT
LWGRRESIMQDFGSLSHVRWECKYHVVFMSERNRNVLYLVEIEMSSFHFVRLARKPRRQG